MSLGYKYIEIWECQWYKTIKCIKKIQKLWRAKQWNILKNLK
jgi:hypothetical protein